MKKSEMREIVEVEIMGRKTVATKIELKKAKGIKNCYFCPVCKELMYEYSGSCRCWKHGFFVNRL